MSATNAVVRAHVRKQRWLPVSAAGQQTPGIALASAPNIGEEAHDGVAASEPAQERRHFEHGVVPQEVRQRRQVRLLERAYVLVDHVPLRRQLWLDDRFFSWQTPA